MIWNIGQTNYTIRDQIDLKNLGSVGYGAAQRSVLHVLNDWFRSGQIHLETSGSTGLPSRISIDKNLVQWSVNSTAKALNLANEKAFICIPLTKIGGVMLLMRSLILDWEIEVEEPSSNPMLNLATNHDFTTISLVPFQLYHIMEDQVSFNKLKRFKTVLIGGEALYPNRENDLLDRLKTSHTQVYHTYGMTETASHIGLRRLGEQYYQAFEDVVLSNAVDGSLRIQIPLIGVDVLSSDVVEILSGNRFQLIGRSEFIVNSAGLKLQLEEVENRLRLKIPELTNFLLWKEPDTYLGERLIMLTESDISPLKNNIETLLPKYEWPRKYYVIDKIVYTESGKKDRAKSYERISRNLL
jgi:O-succinylbenzoic acid--CoA ligase